MISVVEFYLICRGIGVPVSFTQAYLIGAERALNPAIWELAPKRQLLANENDRVEAPLAALPESRLDVAAHRLDPPSPRRHRRQPGFRVARAARAADGRFALAA